MLAVLDASEWARIVEQFENLSLLQTWEFGEAQRAAGWKPVRWKFTDATGVMGAAQVLEREAPVFPAGLAWVNRGPLCFRNVDQILAELRGHYVEKQRMYLRVAPPMTDIRVAGYKKDAQSRGWASARLDLTQPLETLRAKLDKKWRNCLNKAERLLPPPEIGSDRAFETVAANYEVMLKEKNFQTTVTPAFLRAIRSSLLPVTVGDYGGILIATYGKIGEYLVGAVKHEKDAGHFLVWQAIVTLKERGFRWFDLGGMDPEITPKGIYHFKSGLNATPYRYAGDFEAHDGRVASRLIRWEVSRRLHGLNG